jgi:hypothetical protein
MRILIERVCVISCVGGYVSVSIAAGVLVDDANNLNYASTSTDNSVDYVHIRPTVTINQASGQADPTSAGE